MTNDSTQGASARAIRYRHLTAIAALGLFTTLGAAPAASPTASAGTGNSAHASHGVTNAPAPLGAQEPVALPTPLAAATSVPWGVGERLDYEVKFGILRAGSATLEVPEIVDVRGRPAYHAVFHISGGTFFYKVNDTYESWMDTATLASLQFYQTQHQGGKTRIKRYEIFPDRETYKDGNDPEEPSVANPLDDGSFLYAVRTLPLRTGDEYVLNRYYKPDRNPVRIRVVRREAIQVPAGTFAAIVVQPTIKTKGIFSEGGRAEVWLSDDAERVVLQVKSSLSFGSLTMQLRKRQSGHKPGA